MSNPKKILLLSVLFFSSWHIGSAPCTMIPSSIDTTRFIEKACISHTISFTLEAPPNVWGRVMERPFLLGMLWERYGFQPPYTVSRRANALHLMDPSGIEGDIFCIGSDDSTRILFADGRMKNWWLPIGIKGRVLFKFISTAHDETVDVRLFIYGEGTGSVADIVIKACSPILKYYINKRIASNVSDLNILLGDIVCRPAEVRNMLDPSLQPEFERMLDGLFDISEE